jgi:mRNA interferase RelE/StbE
LAWTVEYVSSAEKQLSRIDRAWQRRILDYMDTDVAELSDPRERGSVLTGNLGGLWRYRVGDYRIVCSIEETVRVILVIKIGHRRDVYK